MKKNLFNQQNTKKLYQQLLLLFILFFSGKVWGQIASQYSYSQTTGTFTQLSSGTNLASGSTFDDSTYNISAASLSGFTFRFAGSNYTAFTVSTNGFIGFGSSLMGSTQYAPLSTSTGGNLFAAAMAGDLAGNTANSKVSWLLSGTSPNRVLTVEWFDVKRVSNTSSLSFQIKLYETSNVIEFVYGAYTYSSTTVTNYQVGIKSSTTTTSGSEGFKNRATTSNWNSTTAGTANSAICTLSNSVTKPLTGLIMTWSPPACTNPPTNLTSSNVLGTTATIGWTAASPSPSSGYDYYISTNNTAPNTGTIPTNTTSSTSVNLSSLSEGTTYYWWVRSNCGSDQGSWVSGSNFTTALPTCITPTSQPISLAFGTTSASTINASFTGIASPNTPSGYLILRSTSATAPTLVNGTSYTTNTDATIGGIVYRVLQGSATASLGTSIAETGLTSNTRYYYYIYSFNNNCTGQPYYLTTSPLTGNKITCPAPATNATSTVTNTGVSVSWTASIVGGSAETIKYKFELYSDSGRTTPVAGYPLTDTTSPVNITSGLTVNTNYYYRIIAYNSSCQSTNLDGSFYNGVCQPSSSATNNYISNFTTTKGYTNNITNASTYTTGGYQDNYATQKVEMYPTGSVDFSFANTGGSAGVAIWVDWNNDWVFDASERVYSSGASGVASYVTSGSGSITVPTGTAIGDYRMRIRTMYLYGGDEMNPCGSPSTRSEAEDYKFSVVAQPDYVIYTDATTANNTVNNTLNIYFKDFDGYNNFYTNDQLEIWMHAGIKTPSANWQYQNAGQDFNNTATLIKFTRESTNPNVYKATVKLADWFCIPTGTTVEGLNLVFRNQYGIGGNNQTADMILNLTSAAVTVNVSTIGTASAVTTNSATISWTAPATGAVKGFDYYYSTSNTPPTVVTTPSATVAGNVYTANLSSLSTATTYYFWARTKGCDTNSAWTASGNFTTACAVVNAPTVIQTFDTYLPPCWAEATGAVTSSSVLSGTTSRWDTSANFGNGSGSNKGVKINLYGTNNDWLISNQIDLGTTASQYRVSYKMAVTSYNGTATQSTIGTHQVRLIVSTDGGTTWSNTNIVKTYTGEGVYTNTGTTEHVNLIGYSGIVKFAFVASTTSTSPDVDFHLDDFVVETIPPTLLANNTSAVSLSFADQAITTTSATQSFNLSGLMLTGAPGTITISAPAGFEVSSVDNTTWGTSTTVNYSSSTLADTQVNVRFKPTDCTSISNAALTISGGGATVIPTVTLSGKGAIPVPTAIAGTDITATTFTANWQPVAGATGYELDVYKKGELLTTATEGFESGMTMTSYATGVGNFDLVTGTWAMNRVIKSTTATNNYSNSASGAQLEGGSSSSIISPSYNKLKTLRFHARRGSSATTISVYKIVSGVETLLGTQALANSSPSQYTFDVNETSNDVKIKIVNGSAVAYIDNVIIDYYTINNEYVTNYNPKAIVGNSDIVTGLSHNTTYHYVVRAITSTCESVNSNEIEVSTTNTIIWNNNIWTNTTGPDTTLDAIIRTPYYVKANADEFAVHNLTIENTGLLKIKTGHGITVSGDIITPDNKIIIESDASLTQTKIANGNSNNKAIAKRNVKMKTLDYTYWSSPLQDQILLNTTNVNAANSSGGFSAGTPNNRTYEYNEVTDNFKATTNATFVPAKGYAIRGKSTYGTVLAVDSLTFSGNLHNGDYSIQIQKSKNTTGTGGVIYEHGYNLIGNPYPSNINFINFYNLDQGNGNKNSDVIYGKAWFWTNFSASGTQAGSSYAGNNYATITLAGGTSPTSVDSAEGNPMPNEFIKVAQGFIVQMKGTPPTGTTPNLGTVKFDNSIRTNNNTGHFYNNNKNADEGINRYWVKIVSPYNIANTILIAHMDGATNNYDPDYDAELLAVGDDSFYSKVNAQKLQIQARNNPLNNEDVIVLGTKHAMSGLYKISLCNREGVFAENQKIYLRDKLTETYTDLTIQDYSFNANQGIDDNRFEIVYKNKEVLGTEGIGKSDFLVYRDGNNFVVKSSNNLGRVELYDVTGKLVQSRYSSDKEAKFDSSVLISGVYIIKAENSGNIRTKKIIK